MIQTNKSNYIPTQCLPGVNTIRRRGPGRARSNGAQQYQWPGPGRHRPPKRSPGRARTARPALTGGFGAPAPARPFRQGLGKYGHAPILAQGQVKYVLLTLRRHTRTGQPLDCLIMPRASPEPKPSALSGTVLSEHSRSVHSSAGNTVAFHIFIR